MQALSFIKSVAVTDASMDANFASRANQFCYSPNINWDIKFYEFNARSISA